MIRKWVLSLAILISAASLQADWDPEEAFIDIDSSVLIDAELFFLKNRVMDTLNGSWCSKEKINLLMDLVYLTQPNVCVEIGAFTGSSVLPVAATLRLLQHGRMYAIDAWSNREAVKYLADNDPNKAWWSTVNMKEVRRTFDQMLYGWHLNPYCAAIQESSETAINFLPEIDFLHLDGDYSEIGSQRDVNLYLPKVKSGGYILLSNVFLMVNGTQPKSKAFKTLYSECDVICEIEKKNAVLFQKL